MVGFSRNRARSTVLRRIILGIALLVGATIAHAADEPPHMSTKGPAGFDSLLQPQEAVTDVFTGGRLVGQARVRYSPGAVTLLDVDALIALLPDLIDPAAVRAALAAPALDAHAGMICRADSDNERAACAIYRPAIAGLIFDDQRFRIELFVNPRLLAVHPVAARAYLPHPPPGISLVDQIGGSIAGTGGYATYGFQNRAILASGTARIRGDLSYSSSYGASVDTLVAELDRPGLRYAVGAMWVPGIELIGRRRLIGGGVTSQVDTRLDRTSIAGTPLVVSLPQRARIDIVRDGRLLTSRTYDAGNQTLDTSSLPDGSYEVVLHIQEAGGGAHDERRFFTKNPMIAGIGEPIFFAYAGLLGQDRRNTPFSTTGTPLYLGGVGRRFTAHLALDATLIGTDRTGLLELGGYWLAPAAQIRIAALASIHGDAGVLVQANSSGFSRLAYTIDARRVWSRSGNPLIPLGDVGGADAVGAFDRIAQLAAGSFTQVNATIGYSLKPGQIGITASYRRDQYRARNYAIGPSVYWPVIERAGMQVNLRGDMTVSNRGNTATIGLTFQRIRAASSLTASLGARTTSGVGEGSGTAVIGAIGGSWHRDGVLGGDATLAADAEQEVSGTLVRARAGLATDRGTLYADIAQPIAGTNGSTQYSIDFQTTAAAARTGFALRGREQHDGAIRVSIDHAPRGAPFEILIDNTPRGIVRAGAPVLVPVAAYRQYSVRVRSIGAELMQVDGTPRSISVYPGNVGGLSWAARRVVAMFGRIVWPDGRAVANAAVYVPDAIGSTDDSGFFQIEAATDAVLKVQAADGRVCRLPIAVRATAQGYAALGTLTCAAPVASMQIATAGK